MVLSTPVISLFTKLSGKWKMIHPRFAAFTFNRKSTLLSFIVNRVKQIKINFFSVAKVKAPKHDVTLLNGKHLLSFTQVNSKFPSVKFSFSIGRKVLGMSCDSSFAILAVGNIDFQSSIFEKKCSELSQHYRKVEN